MYDQLLFLINSIVLLINLIVYKFVRMHFFNMFIIETKIEKKRHHSVSSKNKTFYRIFYGYILINFGNR